MDRKLHVSACIVVLMGLVTAAEANDKKAAAPAAQTSEKKVTAPAAKDSDKKATLPAAKASGKESTVTSSGGSDKLITVTVFNHHSSDRKVKGDFHTYPRNFGNNFCMDWGKTANSITVPAKGKVSWDLYFKPPTRDHQGDLGCEKDDCMTACVQLCQMNGDCYYGGITNPDETPMVCLGYDRAKRGAGTLIINNEGKGFDMKNSTGWSDSGSVQPCV